MGGGEVGHLQNMFNDTALNTRNKRTAPLYATKQKDYCTKNVVTVSMHLSGEIKSEMPKRPACDWTLLILTFDGLPAP